MAPWSAPAKAILFGEHAVVYGEPALAVALDRRVTVDVSPADRYTVNDRPMTDRHHGYIKKATELVRKGGPLRITTMSDIPSAAGMGSSAAITVATVAAVMGVGDGFDPEMCARAAHRVECMEEGRAASPLDTSTCTLGSGVLVAREKGEGLKWEIGGGGVEIYGEGGERKGVGEGKEGGGAVPEPWYVHQFRAPAMTVVLGHTGLKGKTRAQVQKVSQFTSRQKGFAQDILREIGDITKDGARALTRGDHTLLGELMDRNDKLLGILGVSSRELSRLAAAARRHSYGAKMIGAGGGGCMMALTDKPEETAEAIRKAGGEPYILQVTDTGVGPKS